MSFEDDNDGFQFQFLLAAIAFLIWLKLFFSFKTTRLFGPMIQIMEKMFVDLIRFLLVWIVQLTAFSCVLTIAYGDIGEFKHLEYSFLYLIEAALGNWDFDAFDNIENEVIKKLGIWIIMVFLILNMVLMLNLVIAIMSQSFSDMHVTQLGLYWSIMLKEFNDYEWDDKYGSLACGLIHMQILNIITVPLLEISSCFGPGCTEAINEFFAYVHYFPVAVCVTAAFAIQHAITVPFAYLLHLMRLIESLSCSKASKHSTSVGICSVLVFLVFGLPWLILSVAIDTLVFAKNLFSAPDKDPTQEIEKNEVETFERSTFDLMIKLCAEFMEEATHEDKNGNMLIEINTYNKRLQECLNLE